MTIVFKCKFQKDCFLSFELTFCKNPTQLSQIHFHGIFGPLSQLHTQQRLDVRGKASCLTPFCKFAAECGGMDVPDFYRSAQEGENKTYKGLSTTHSCVLKKALTKIQSIIF